MMVYIRVFMVVYTASSHPMWSCILEYIGTCVYLVRVNVACIMVLLLCQKCPNIAETNIGSEISGI